MRLAAALFDIDGTLVDTSILIREAVTQVLVEAGITPTPEEMVAGWSLRAADRMQLWVAERAAAEDLAARYQDRYLELHDALVRPFPGMTETLQDLAARGIALGVVTSKRALPARRTLAAFGYERFIRVLITEEDTAEPKPDPAPVRRAAAHLAAIRGGVVMVGDGAVDVQAGARAGMRTAGALWGALDRDALRAANPTWLLEAPPDLRNLPWKQP